MKNLINTQSGFSLVQGMVIAGVLAGSSLVATRLLTDQKLAQKGAETRDQIDDFHDVLYSALQNRDNCTATITGNSVDSPLVNAANPVLPDIRTLSGSVMARIHNGTFDISDTGKNVYMNGNVIIKTMKLYYGTVLPDGSALPTGQARLFITYERLSGTDPNATNQFSVTKKTKNGYGSKSITKSINLRIQTDVLSGLSPKPFKSCYGLTADKDSGSANGENGNDISKELCLEMNNNVQGDGSTTGNAMFIWDEATSTCIPNAKCPDHMINTGIDSLGAVKCRLLSDWADFGTMIQPTSGTCGANIQTRLEIVSSNPVRFRIKCGP